jgi:hypothetical protein
MSPATGEPSGAERAAGIVRECAMVLRQARERGYLPGLDPTFAFRRGEGRRPVSEEPGRALPAHVVAELDAHLHLLRAVPGPPPGSRRGLGILGSHAGEMAVLAYQLLKLTGRRVGEVACLRLDCVEVDRDGKAVLVYDNHKARRMGRRLPLADSDLVEAIAAQQRWVTERFADPPGRGCGCSPGP